MPSVGFKVFNVKSGDGTVETNLSVEENENLFVMENAFLKVEIDKNTGNIAQVYNKKDGNRPVFADGYQGNEIHIYKGYRRQFLSCMGSGHGGNECRSDRYSG